MTTQSPSIMANQDRSELRFGIKFGVLVLAVAAFVCYSTLGGSLGAKGRAQTQSLPSLDASRALLDDGDDCDLSTTQDMCTYLQTKCKPSGFINYLQAYYCGPLARAKWALWLFFVIWLLVLFFILAKSADTYFCPTLSIIAEKLHMSEELAGLTILALGNGAPDVSSTIASALSANFELGLGELFGAGLFVSACVVAAVTFATKEAPLDTHNFLRDIIFYLVAVVGVFFISWDQKIELWESVVFLVYYIGYVLFATLVHYCSDNRKKRKMGGASINDSEDREGIPLLEKQEDPDDDEDSKPFIIAEWTQKFLDQSLLRKVITVFMTIAQLPLMLSTPTVQWNRYSAIIIPMGAPVAAMLILGHIGDTVMFGTVAFPIVVFVLAGGIALSIAVLCTTSFHEKPIYYPVFVILGFAMSIGWIFLAANELVALLQAVGLIINVSQIILGATILAWGNSIGDMVADVLMARQGYAGMAVAATYGGPLFNLLLGLGISLTILCAKQYPTPYTVQIDHVFFVTAGFLFWNLWSSLVIITIRRFKLQWPIGIFLILNYVVFSVILILVELDVIWPDKGQN